MESQELDKEEVRVNTNEITVDLLLDRITLNEIQKYVLAVFYVFITLFILEMLEFTKGIHSPKVAGIKSLNYSSNVQSLLLFLQLLFCIALAPFTIYDILKDKFFQNIKKQTPIFLIVSGILSFVPILILYYEDQKGNNNIVYVGVEPEILIAAIIFSFFLYFSPPFLIVKYYKKHYSSLNSI